MLQELYIKNIALIKELSLSFEKGLNILSGETGAGKSIIVDAMSLILGERGMRELIRREEQKARVEALVTVENGLLPASLLEEFEIESEFTVSRELSVSGKSVCRINGHMVPLNTLKEVMAHFINLHGQGQHQEIFEKKRQLVMLDRFSENESQLAAVSQAYAGYLAVKKERDALFADMRERERMLDMLQFQVREIEVARLQSGEEEALSAERHKIKNAEKIAQNLHKAHGALSLEGGGLEKLSQAVRALSDIAEYDEAFARIANAVNDAYYALEDAAYELSELAQNAMYDPLRIEEIESRLAQISTLKRKYGDTVEDILAFAEEANQKLERLTGSEERMVELERSLLEHEQTLRARCEALSKARKNAALQLQRELIGHLADLGMGDAQFHVAFEKKGLSANGQDDVEFFISLNRGEPEKPLAKVVSGGEASRIMLAVQNIFARKEETDTLIFDEIDTGISGVMARKVANKLANISKERQVICVSHLPQIAAMGDVNYVVQKNSREDGVLIDVLALSKEQKQREIARLSGGIQTQAAIAHARELIEECDCFKKAI